MFHWVLVAFHTRCKNQQIQDTPQNNSDISFPSSFAALEKNAELMLVVEDELTPLKQLT
jgi:hypothetical protein